MHLKVVCVCWGHNFEFMLWQLLQKDVLMDEETETDGSRRQDSNSKKMIELGAKVLIRTLRKFGKGNEHSIISDVTSMQLPEPQLNEFCFGRSDIILL